MIAMQSQKSTTKLLYSAMQGQEGERGVQKQMRWKIVNQENGFSSTVGRHAQESTAKQCYNAGPGWGKRDEKQKEKEIRE